MINFYFLKARQIYIKRFNYFAALTFIYTFVKIFDPDDNQMNVQPVYKLYLK